MTIKIQRYPGGRDEEIASLILGIQNREAGLGLTVDDQPDLLNIAIAYAAGGFWVALDDGAIIGTIGLLTYDRRGVVKKFFVAAPYRGRAGPAAQLFEALLERAHALGMVDIILDTPTVATRSHGFYAKAGFQPITAKQLPSGYTYPDRESLLLGLRLSL